ncbi:LAME_0C05820g1_1 [Lachancea meyersii CBS 8951]|uniref:LAME_0C05820g1_1 n=1 Tax=Lachancea meyersii CBS 8951 TaxID=1266667 RepID=A0A1G4J1V4_9SACH|nr:LAME_0C05820g1_1 [Lachancea meyersii CBS 8951]
MVLHFSQLPHHRTYVLHWYRYTLRNIPRNVHSEHLQLRIKSVTRTTVLKHRSDKSSWSIYKLLRDLKKLNTLLLKSKTEKVWELLTLYSRKTSGKGKKSSLPICAPPKAPEQDPETVRNAKLLHDYITEKQRRSLLPNNLADEFKLKLVLPLALHEHNLQKLHRIEYKLASGPPKVSLNYTSAGKARIWFVRSAVNKGKRQSRGLGRIIRLEKKKGQNNLDYWNSIHENSRWAWHEAVWEHLIETNSVIQGSPEKFLSSTAKPINKTGHVANVDENRVICEWLNPLKESLEFLSVQSERQAKYFEEYKRKATFRSQCQYFAQKTDLMYQNRKRRYTKMLNDDLPFVTPFFRTRNLPAVLKAHKF